MENLQKCIELNNQIKQIEEKIMVLTCRIMSPKNQIISDMPRGGGGGENAIEKYIEKKDELKARRTALIIERSDIWHNLCEQMTDIGIPRSHRTLIELHFIMGISWKDSTEIMKKNFPDEKWNKNKCFRVYRGIRARLREL